MQDAYVGDIGDFGKFALLRLLNSRSGLETGILWHAVDPTMMPKRATNKDGKHRTYLNTGDPHHVKDVDVVLYSKFVQGRFERPGGHKIAELQTVCNDFTYFDSRCHSAKYGVPFERTAWITKALSHLEKCELIFFDPDNGITTGTESPKHVHTNELKQFWQQNKSLVVYHHLPRRNHIQEIEIWRDRLTTEFQVPDVFPVHFRRGTGRVYFVIPRPEHKHLFPTLEEIKEAMYLLMKPLHEVKRIR